MEKKTVKILGRVIWIFLLLGVAIIFYKKYRFMKSYKFTTGRVTEITGPGYHSTGDFSVIYDYQIDNKKYHNNESYNYCGGMSMSEAKSLLVGKQFPVAYSANDAGTCSMLITQENADRFHYQLPDSVKYYDSVLTCKE